jgi:hypothetical protein
VTIITPISMMTIFQLFRSRVLTRANLVLALLTGTTAILRASTERELIQDPHFQRGFFLWKPAPFHEITYGTLKGLEAGSTPKWALSQWNSKFPLGPDGWEMGGNLVYSNEAKKVILGAPGSAAADLSLAVNAGVEYGAHARKSSAEPWVHLLVQQEVHPRASLHGPTAVNLHIEARLAYSRLLQGSDYTPNLHAAMFQIFFAIGNTNKQSAGFQDFLWFGVPIYDNRARFPPAFKAQDFGGTAKFIFTPEGREFTSVSAHDGNWVTIDRDLLPLMRQSLDTAWSQGYLKGSRNFADYAICAMTMGWELPGTFDVNMQVRNFSLKIIRDMAGSE